MFNDARWPYFARVCPRAQRNYAVVMPGFDVGETQVDVWWGRAGSVMGTNRELVVAVAVARAAASNRSM
jgi:hypothetical protein